MGYRSVVKDITRMEAGAEPTWTYSRRDLAAERKSMFTTDVTHPEARFYLTWQKFSFKLTRQQKQSTINTGLFIDSSEVP